jgi:hypothetical protein
MKKACCKDCKQTFDYVTYGNGMNQNAHAYCNKCGMACVLGIYYPKIPPASNFLKRHPPAQLIDATIEEFLKYCPCGGKFKHNALPRCPHCNKELIEFNTSYYKFVTVMIDGKKIEDWWKEDWQGDEQLPKESLGSKIKGFFRRRVNQ